MKKSKIKFSIKYKYILFVTFLVLLLSVINTYLTLQNQTRTLRKEIIKRAEGIVRKLASDSVDAILTKDDITLFTGVKNAMAEKGIQYAMILDEERIPICHNDTEYLADHKYPLKDKVTINAFKGNALLVQDMVYQGESSFDVSSPIIWNRKKIGLIRVGFSKEPIKEVIRNTTGKALTVALIAVFIGVILTILLTTYILEPIKLLMKGVERISEGNFNHPIKIKQRDEFFVLADTFNDMQKSIKKMMNEIAEQEALRRELQIASQIQEMLIPKESPKMDGLDIRGYSQQATEVGGDYFDFFYIDKNNLGTILADVSGHGVSAALIMVMVRMVFKSISKDVKTPAHLLALSNKLLEGDMLEDKFITMIYYNFDARSKKLTLSNAGHPPLLWYKNKDKKIQEVGTNGFPIGVMENAEYENVDLLLKKGDVVLVYTDGFIEIKNEKEEEFGLERLKNIVVKSHELSSEAIIGNIVESCNRFSDIPMQDDKTMVVLKVAG
ncbi:MAG: SpoIIE family protein phosphatase [Spirochaetes bacterium]|nr:SpoIIE family protein phosphatase [Spirochaetota bacterium]